MAGATLQVGGRASAAAPDGAARISPRFLEHVPIHYARRHVVIGLDTDDVRVVEILSDNNSKQAIVDNLGLTLNAETHLRLDDPANIHRLINWAYEQQRYEATDLVAGIDAPEVTDVDVGDRQTDLLEHDRQAPVIRLVNLLLYEAAQRRASDIHIHPTEDDAVVRLRIDGVLFDYLQPGKHLQDEILSRIKVMAGMDIAEKRKPQDGRATVRIGARLIDLRIATLPTVFGERAVLRLLDKGARLYGLSELGMPDDLRDRLESLIQCAHGMVLMTGPTGSGKSTTLYAALQRIDYQRLNVVTLEDPIEYHLPGISQTQVAEKRGLNFAAGLRSILRQDPDVIMVGEIRDAETARLAIQSALTGHLVLSTLHTNDAAGAVARLLDLGIEAYLVADSLLTVGAQRLVRLNCSQCSTPKAIDARDAARLGLPSDSRIQFGQGCEHCGGTGFYERHGIFELLCIDERVRGLIHDRARADVLRRSAVEGGMRTLRDDGARLVLAGRTTPGEVLRVTQGFAAAIIDGGE